jgi:arylsulfatase A-like enzyme
VACEIVNRMLLVVVAALCLGACDQQQENVGPPNILLISIDALRADHLSCYGYDRHTSPVLDGLAARGTRFSHAFVNTHGTPPSHATLFSSLYQESHRVGIDGELAAVHTIPARVAMAQEMFVAAGWHTVAVTGGGYMSAEFGFSSGFDEYIDRARSVDQGARILLDHLRPHIGGNRPIFAFLHTYQVHSPYAPPEDFRRLFGDHQGAIEATNEALLEIQGAAAKVLSREDFEYLEALYDGEIRYTDEVLGELLSSLGTIGFLDNAVVVVTADHGEEFGEHGGVLHGGKLFEELLHVPLIINGTGIERGLVDPALVSLVDVAPTLLALAGLEVSDGMEGRDILDRRESERWEDQRVFAQYADRLYCVRTPRWKLIQWTANQRVRLFDLLRDPGERRDVSGRHPDLVAGLLAELEEWRAQRARIDLGEREDIELSQERLDELRALGYVH